MTTLDPGASASPEYTTTPKVSEENEECPPNQPREIETTDARIAFEPEPLGAPDASHWGNSGFKPERYNLGTGEKLALNADGALSSVIPTGYFALAAAIPDANAAVNSIARLLSSEQPMCLISLGRVQYIYRLAGSLSVPENFDLPDGVKLIVPGEVLPLPSGAEFDASKYAYNRLDALPETTEVDFARLRTLQLEPEVKDTPFSTYSVLGQSASFEAMAVAATPLLGTICMRGQVTILYAPPNAGKTLISIKMTIDAVQNGLINPANVYYINADDSSQGLAEKLTLMDELGIHTLVPGQRNFWPESLADLLRKAAANGKARGVLVIIDTVKKFTSLMDKAKASAFANACRMFALAGGAVVGFAHTNKKPSADGRLTYSGTTDLVDDSDAAYMMTPMRVDDHNETVVTFENIKRRGNNAETATFAYSRDPDISYAERLMSVREVDPNDVEGFRRREAERDSGEVIAIVKAILAGGKVAKMALAKLVAAEADISRRAAVKILEQYTGVNHAEHHWRFVRGERGVQMFELLVRPESTLHAGAG